MSDFTLPHCSLCHRPCDPNPDLVLPRCAGKNTNIFGGAHFVCEACVNHTFRRVNTDLVECPGCSTGLPFYEPSNVTIRDLSSEDDIEMC